MLTQEDRRMAETVRLGLVGCGSISRCHVRGYNDLFGRGCKEFQVTACCDLKQENAEGCAEAIAEAQGFKPQVFTHPDDMVAAGVVDAADLCLPHCFHHTAAIPLLEAGLHVMVEKPLGITIKATRKIIEAAEKHDRVLACAENVRRDMPARACEWAINTKRLIGDVRLVNIQHISLQPFDYERPAFKWRGLKLLTGGGMIMDSGAHFGDMIQVLFGEVDEVYCDFSVYDERLIEDAPILGDAKADVEDTWHAVLRFKGGPLVSWTYSRSLPEKGIRAADYLGSEGVIKDLGFPFHPFQGGGRAILADGAEVSKEEIEAEYMASLSEEQKARLFPYGATDGFAVEIWDFINAVATGRKPEMDGYDALRAKALCESCYESAIAGQPVKFADVVAGRVNAYQQPIDEYWKI